MLNQVQHTYYKKTYDDNVEYFSEEICKFGDKTLKVGQRFAKTNITDKFGRSFDKVECECDIPPFVRCRNV